MKVYRKGMPIAGLDIMKYTYSGKDMGERSITATIKSAYPLGLQIGDYVVMDMNNLLKGGTDKYMGGIYLEKFYMYNLPTIKKRSSKYSTGDAFETTVQFYPRQYELGIVQMRDFITAEATASNIIYTGFENVTFFGGAKMLLDKIVACLNNAHDNGTIDGTWDYVLADGVNEELNPALNQFTFVFNGNSVMEALQFLNKEEYCNTTFFINERTIYVGTKRPYLCSVDMRKQIIDNPLMLKYGKTSHENIDIDHGGLFDITKAIGSKSPITRLYAYGTNRNLNRYYCSDRITSGRYVNKLMLPSFSEDGVTDYLDSDDETIAKFGIREGTKTFEDIYPSLRYMTYGDLRKIKYVIKVRCNADDEGKDLSMHSISDANTLAIARVQCYKVVPSSHNSEINTLVESWPDHPIAVSVHAAGKIVKTIIHTGEDEQKAQDPVLPTRNGAIVPGAAFLVHMPEWKDIDGKGTETYGESKTSSSFGTHRRVWFDKPTDDESWEGLHPTEDGQDIANRHRIIYEDTFWLTDIYKFEKFDQTHFNRDGYSAYCWARFNNRDKYPDSTLVNEVVYVEPIVLSDTSWNMEAGFYQRGFDVYLRDVGFEIDEQNDFGEMVHAIMGDVKMSFLDGMLAGREYNVQKFVNSSQDSVIPAYNVSGKLNDGTGDSPISFFEPSDNNGSDVPRTAFDAGAMWRIRLVRAAEGEEENYGLIIPTKEINAEPGDHVVLLDIQMPDIYIKSAEERLRIEAQKYLDRVDCGDVSYSVSIDKVRFNQIPNYAKQMREGVTVRIADEDIQVGTDVREKPMFTSKGGVKTSVHVKAFLQKYLTPEYVYHKEVKSETTVYESQFNVLVEKDHVNDFLNNREILMSDEKGEEKTIRFYGTSLLDKNSYTYLFDDKRFPSKALTDDNYDLYIVMTYSPNDVAGVHNIGYRILKTLNVLPELGENIFVQNDTIIEFDGDYVYKVLFEMDMDIEKRVRGYYIMKPDGTTYKIEDIIEEDCEYHGHVATVVFSLPSSYSIVGGAKFCVEIEYDGTNDNAITLYSVIRKNINAKGSHVDYVDMVVESVNVEIDDNTRDDDNRIVDVVPEPIRTVQANLKVKTQSSAWAELTGAVDEVKNEQELHAATIASIVQSARKNYINLLNLRNNIFDPDGTCTDTFVQTMMLQVGADSMNYMLEKTGVGVDGTTSNIDMPNNSIKIGADILHHYVYTQGGQGGNWVISAMPSYVNLDPSNPVYYIAIKASKDQNIAEWIVEPVQHMVNEDTNNWYFNYGILTLDGSKFSLMETRGNAYMYGDNLVCGKISDLAHRSWFDLTKGDFVLGSSDPDNPDAFAKLKYVNGTLTISGLPDEQHIQEVMDKLAEIETQNIGGENLSEVSKLNGESEMIAKLESGTQYVFSAMHHGGSFNLMLYTRRAEIIEAFNFTVEKRVTTVFSTPNYFGDILLSLEANDEDASMTNIMVQKGNKATEYQEYVKHITDAIKGTTEVTGGLILSNALMLRDENNQVKAGMSGLIEDDNDVAMWAGGTYAQALLNQVAVLLTKSGVGSRIGCFRVVSDTEVEVISQYGRIGIDTAEGSIRIYDSNGDEKVVLSTRNIEDTGALPSNPVTGQYTTLPTQKVDGYRNDWEYNNFGPTFNISTYSKFVITQSGSIRTDNIVTRMADKVVSAGGGKIQFGIRKGEHGEFVAISSDINWVYNGRVSLPFYQNTSLNLTAGNWQFCVRMTSRPSTAPDSIGRPISASANLLGDTIHYEIAANFKPKTVIGINGFCTAYDGRHFFKIVNTSSGQLISAPGLRSFSQDMETGDIYQDEDGFVKIV